MLAVGLGYASSEKVPSHSGLYIFSVNAGFSPWHWYIYQMACNQGISRSGISSELSRSLLWQPLWDLEAPMWPLAGPLWVGAVFSTLLVTQREKWESSRLMQCWDPPLKPLCSYIIQLECSVVSWFLGQLAESLTIPLFLLLLAKKCYPPVASFSLFATTVWRSIIKILK